MPETMPEETPETRPDDDRYLPRPFVRISHPDWTRRGAIYELNLRQFTAEGTFAAAQTREARRRHAGSLAEQYYNDDLAGRVHTLYEVDFRTFSYPSAWREA